MNPMKQFLVWVLPFSILLTAGCRTRNAEQTSLMSAIDQYESAWASEDFSKVESFFTVDAKRLHTEPHVWDRAEIKRYFQERAAQAGEVAPKEPAQAQGNVQTKRNACQRRESTRQ